MKKKTVLFSVIAIMLVLLIPSVGRPQHKPSGQKNTSMPGMPEDMARMMQSPHHKLMTAYMKSMTAFATTLRDQAMKGTLDAEVARAAVAELRHNLDAAETLHQKYMQSMSAEMQSKMQTMMEKMDKDRAMLKDQVSTLETDVQADKPDSAQVTAHANALLKHLGMMSLMHTGNNAPKKKMDMKKPM
jgi:MbeD/MobD like